jgi:hypothetical protein
MSWLAKLADGTAAAEMPYSVLNLYVPVDAARHIMFCGLQQPFPGLELAMSTGAQLHYDAVSFVSDKPVLLNVDSIGRFTTKWTGDQIL